MMKNESGRSMVEMLGVLAIIGVLSVGGIAGYTMAMRKYKANEIIAAAAQCNVIATSANMGTGDTKCDGVTLDANIASFTANTINGAAHTVGVTFVDSKVCDAAAAIKTPTTNNCNQSTATLIWTFS